MNKYLKQGHASGGSFGGEKSRNSANMNASKT